LQKSFPGHASGARLDALTIACPLHQPAAVSFCRGGPLAGVLFSEEKVSEVRDRASILEVVSDYVSLKKTGRNYKGLCPFHSEKTPSFMVNEEKQIFHCFGCGEGGDVFAFLIKAAHYTFPQALEELARRYGVALPSRELTPGQKREMDHRESLFAINQKAADYFHDLLTRRPEGEAARLYLSKRGLSDDLIREYRLGYALESWDGLARHFRQERLSLEGAAELGLVVARKTQGWYDAFRGRILFPILDLHQRVVGFGGRLIGPGEPKYLNSPETPLFHKGEVLYGLDVARRFISERDRVILVEGYFDLLALHQHGFRNSVATCGTALTASHLRILKRYTRNFVTVFDGDTAGLQASLRALPLVLDEEVWGRTFLLPAGEDPDSFLLKGEAGAFDKGVASAMPLMDFFFDRLGRSYNLRSVEGKVRAAREAMEMIRRVKEPIERDAYLRALAERLDVKESSLLEMARPAAGAAAPGARPDRLGTPGDTKGPASEEMVIRVMILRPEWIPFVSGQGVLDVFENPVLKHMGFGLEALYREKGKVDLSEAQESLGETFRPMLRELAFLEKGLEAGETEKILKDCIRKIRDKRKNEEKRSLLKRIREAEQGSGSDRLEDLLSRRQALEKPEKDLLSDGFS
jgi:DNA primase